MPPYVDTETGETFESCPACEQTRRDAEVQIVAMEQELRSKRAKITRLENQLVVQQEYKADAAAWKQILAHWKQAFPDKRITSTSVKSARATACFQRLDLGASGEDFLLAIDGAKRLPYVVYGSRRKTGSASDLRVDLQHIASIGNDAQFDALVEAGRAAREEEGLF